MRLFYIEMFAKVILYCVHKLLKSTWSDDIALFVQSQRVLVFNERSESACMRVSNAAQPHPRINIISEHFELYKMFL